MKKKLMILSTLFFIVFAIVTKLFVSYNTKDYVFICTGIYLMLVLLENYTIDKYAVRPLKRLRYAITKMAELDFSEDLNDIKGKDEIGQIASLYNQSIKKIIENNEDIKLKMDTLFNQSNSLRDVANSRYNNINALICSLNNLKESLNIINSNEQLDVISIENLHNHITEIKCSDSICANSLNDILARMQNNASSLEEITNSLESLWEIVLQEQLEYKKIVDLGNMFHENSKDILNQLNEVNKKKV